MFHHFSEELPLQNYLVSSTTFSYEETPTVTYLSGITHSGYLLQNNRYVSKSLPQLELTYSRFPSEPELHSLIAGEVHSKSLENLPYIDDEKYQWVDLNGEGLPGVLTEQAEGWYYKSNLSANRSRPTLSPTILLYDKPSTSLAECFFADVDGSGVSSLVKLDKFAPGFYIRQGDVWTRFKEFHSFPKNLNEKEHRYIDLTGNGLPDILVTEDYVFTFFVSFGQEGYSQGFRVPQSYSEEKGPCLLFSDPEQTIYLADMSGDGLTDLLRIRNGDVVYWPNTGYGTFGAKVTMCTSPWFAGIILTI